MAVVLACLFLASRSGRSRSSAGRSSWLGVAADPARLRAASVTPMTGAPTPVPPAPRDGEPPLALLIDYDGTIALTDVSDTVMAEHVPGGWEAEAAAVRRRADGLAPADGPGDGDGRQRPGRRCTRRPPPSPTTRVRPVRPDAPRRPASRSRSCRTGSASSSSRRWSRSGCRSCPIVTARTTFQGRRASIAYPERQPALPRVRDVQARPRAGPPRGRATGRVHRRRRERPLRRRLQRRRVRQALAGAHLPGGRLAVPALDRVPRDRDWLAATLAAWRADPSTLPRRAARRAAAERLLLRRRRSGARAWSIRRPVPWPPPRR